MNSNKKGFTLIEMVFCISVILVILLLVIPNVTSKNRLVKEKSCMHKLKLLTHKSFCMKSSMENYQLVCLN